MTVDEQTRQRVLARLREVLGEEAAITLMAGVPPFDWSQVATKTDVYAVRDLIGELRGEMGGEIGGLRGEIGGLRGEIGELRGEIGELRGELHSEISQLRGELHSEISQLRGELHGSIGELRGEMGQVEARLSTAMATQTRYYMVATVGAVLTTGALAFAAAGLT